MIFLGHLGMTTVAVQTYNHALRKRVDLRLAGLASILPDVIDKPLGLLAPETFGYHTKLYAHSLVACFLFLGVAFALRHRVTGWFVIWLAYASHLAFDRMWVADREMLFWPFLGASPPLGRQAYTEFFVGGFRDWVLYSEAAGAALLVAFALFYRLYRFSRIKRLIVSGSVDREP